MQNARSGRPQESSKFPSGIHDQRIDSFLEALDCPRSLAAYLMYRAGEHRQLLDLRFDPLHYNDLVHSVDLVKRSYCATEWLSKGTFLSTQYDLKANALEKFWDAEAQCRATNLRIKAFERGDLQDPRLVAWLLAMQRKIAYVLGEFDPNEWFDSCGWGPGVTTALSGASVSGAHKFSASRELTKELGDFILPLIKEGYPGWGDFAFVSGVPFVYEVGNKVTTVPKNAKTDRVIAIEPALNLWFQKGLGTMIRTRLRRVGIDLNSQSRNQHLARRAVDCGLATVDFSSASDTISKYVVRHLLPEPWFTLLNLCRCPSGTVDGSTHRWEKFSSMGNGFTFELESLIFFAMSSVVSDTVSVYGDDVIVDHDAQEDFQELASFLGFTVNKKKSFWTGLFFESCGAHFWNGSDITPIYQKSRISTVEAAVKHANSIRRFAYLSLSLDRRYLKTWKQAVKAVPTRDRYFGPEILGDTVIHDSVEGTYRPGGWSGTWFISRSETPCKVEVDSYGLMLHRLVTGSDTLQRNSVPLRGLTRIKLVKVFVRFLDQRSLMWV